MGWHDRTVRRVRDLSCGDTRIFLELEVRRVECRRCGKVKRERLEFLAVWIFFHFIRSGVVLRVTHQIIRPKPFRISISI